METLNEISIKYSLGNKVSKSITNSKEAAELVREIYQKTESHLELKEYFFILLLNRNNRVIGYHKLSEGGISGTIADIRLAFATALKCLASGMIMVHNHPSGNTRASESDKKLTKCFRDAGKILDIQVLDHIILTVNGFSSFADEGHL